jgi:hypothetical protein
MATHATLIAQLDVFRGQLSGFTKDIHDMHESHEELSEESWDHYFEDQEEHRTQELRARFTIIRFLRKAVHQRRSERLESEGIARNRVQEEPIIILPGNKKGRQQDCQGEVQPQKQWSMTIFNDNPKDLMPIAGFWSSYRYSEPKSIRLTTPAQNEIKPYLQSSLLTPTAQSHSLSYIKRPKPTRNSMAPSQRPRLRFPRIVKYQSRTRNTIVRTLGKPEGNAMVSPYRVKLHHVRSEEHLSRVRSEERFPHVRSEEIMPRVRSEPRMRTEGYIQKNYNTLPITPIAMAPLY